MAHDLGMIVRVLFLRQLSLYKSAFQSMDFLCSHLKATNRGTSFKPFALLYMIDISLSSSDYAQGYLYGISKKSTAESPS
jgi:hypothetical protein